MASKNNGRPFIEELQFLRQGFAWRSASGCRAALKSNRFLRNFGQASRRKPLRTALWSLPPVVLQRYSNQNPLYFVKAALVVAAIVKAGGAGALVVRHLLRHFKLAAVALILRDAGGAEGVAVNPGCDAGVGRRPIMRYTSGWLMGRPVRMPDCSSVVVNSHALVRPSLAVLLRRGVEALR